MKIAAWIVGIVAAFLLFGAVAGSSPQAKEKAKARAAIDLCWEEQKRKSIDPPAQRFIAAACESMENRFVTEFGHRP